MTRNWKMLTLATLLALASAAPAQKVAWRPTQSTETTCPAEGFPQSGRTIWDCLACDELQVTHGKEAAARILMSDLMAEFKNAFNRGDLRHAELIADFACKLQPECKEAQRAQWLVSIAKQTRLGVEECCEHASKCDCGDKCCCKSQCQCGDKCDDQCACKKDARLRSHTVPKINKHQCTVREVLPAPTLTVTADQPPSPPCSRPAVVSTDDLVCAKHVRVLASEPGAEDPRPKIVVPGLVAHADHVYLVGHGKPERILLEGNVEMNLTQKDHPARIVTGRAVISPRDGSYEIMPVNFDTARPVKPMPVLKPTSDVMPVTPMSQGWR
jgi:hypothetical protein